MGQELAIIRMKILIIVLQTFDNEAAEETLNRQAPGFSPSTIAADRENQVQLCAPMRGWLCL